MTYIDDVIMRLREADDKARRSAGAFLAGRFDEYLQAEYGFSTARIDAASGLPPRGGSIPGGGSGEAISGDGAGDIGGGSSGGPGGSP